MGTPVGTSGLSLAEDQSALGVIEICGERTDVRPEAEGKDIIIPQSQGDMWLVVGESHRAGTTPPSLRARAPLKRLEPPHLELVIGSCEFRCWELNSGPLQEQ